MSWVTSTYKYHVLPLCELKVCDTLTQKTKIPPQGWQHHVGSNLCQATTFGSQFSNCFKTSSSKGFANASSSTSLSAISPAARVLRQKPVMTLSGMTGSVQTPWKWDKKRGQVPEAATSVDMSSEKASMEQKSKGLGFVYDHVSFFSSILRHYVYSFLGLSLKILMFIQCVVKYIYIYAQIYAQLMFVEHILNPTAALHMIETS